MPELTYTIGVGRRRIALASVLIVLFSRVRGEEARELKSRPCQPPVFPPFT